MHTYPACNASQALFRVFVFPALHNQRLLRAGNRRVEGCFPRSHKTTRLFSSTPSTPFRGGPGGSRPAEVRAQKWNSEITAREIHLVDPATGRLAPEGPRMTYDILNSLNTDTHRLVQVSQDDDANHSIPICKIVSKQEAWEADKRRKQVAKEARKAGGRSGESGMKTLELNWAIDGNDLAHRLDKMKEFLEQGRKVEIVLAAKKRGRKASSQECEDVLNRIHKVVETVKGAREKTPLKGKVGGFATVVFQVLNTGASATTKGAEETAPKGDAVNVDNVSQQLQQQAG